MIGLLVYLNSLSNKKRQPNKDLANYATPITISFHKLWVASEKRDAYWVIPFRLPLRLLLNATIQPANLALQLRLAELGVAYHQHLAPLRSYHWRLCP